MSAVSSFNTGEVRPWNMPEQKTSKTINLPQTYVSPPRIVVGLTSVDMQTGTNLRVQAYADGIDRQKYTAHMDTWADTTLYSGRFDALVLKPANLDILSGQFSTAEDHSWNEPKVKTSRRINFERSFITPPKVVVFLNSFDTGSGSSTRVTTYASGIDAKGFTIHIDTWSDTTLYSASAGWIAYPEDKDYIFSGAANTTEVRPWQTPQAKTRASFLKKPTIFVALNSIDISTQTKLRVLAYVDNVTTDGLTWHIDSWADTKLWSAGISYIAFN
ncbi:hypothetical protein FS837_002168 [Tulasnella sp. UAMH 9824]|nr:hypothetical protein FS837_002168 [Tulasnella sp. UAMH 9824]